MDDSFPLTACVTGATGFIGWRLCHRLFDLGYKVIAVGKINNSVEQGRWDSLERSGIKFREGDVTDTLFLHEAMEGCNLVFHLAAAQHEADVGEEYFRKINVEGTGNVLEEAIKAGVSRFVHGSTIGVYGAAMEGELSEESELQPTDHYGRTKLAGEQLALSYRDRMDIAVVRISETYGPGDRRLLKLFRGIKKGTFFVAGSGENIHQLIFVDDLVEGLLAAARKPEAVGQLYVLAGSERLTTNRMCNDVACALGSAKKLLRLPYLPLRIIIGVAEKVCVKLGAQPPIKVRSLDFFTKSFFFRQDKARNQLRFIPATSFVVGAKKTAEWYRQQGLL